MASNIIPTKPTASTNGQALTGRYRPEGQDYTSCWKNRRRHRSPQQACKHRSFSLETMTQHAEKNRAEQQCCPAPSASCRDVLQHTGQDPPAHGPDTWDYPFTYSSMKQSISLSTFLSTIHSTILSTILLNHSDVYPMIYSIIR